MTRTRPLLATLAALLGCLAGCCSTGKPRTLIPEDGETRAGYPSQVSCLAKPSDTGKYVGYEVGGGAAYKGEGPTADDGTWGWDYGGCLLPSRIILGWWHGRKEQGGGGDYRTDGPRPIQAIERRHEE